MPSPAALNAARTHCVHGHPFNEENTYRYTTPGGTPGRKCRACQRRHNAETARLRKESRDRQRMRTYVVRTVDRSDPMLNATSVEDAVRRVLAQTIGQNITVVDWNGDMHAVHVQVSVQRRR